MREEKAMEQNISDSHVNDLHERCVEITSELYRQEFFLPSETETVIMTYVIPIILFVGVPANMCFLIMMARFPHMRSTVNYYLTSLAIADLLILILGGTDKLARHFTASGYIFLPQGTTGMYCAVFDLIMCILFISSMFHITLVTLEIFYALCKPIEHRRISSKRRTFGLISLSWLAAFIFGLASNFPLWANTQYYCVEWPDGAAFKKYSSTFVMCGVANGFYAYINTSQSVEFVAYLVALIVNCVLYFLIICKVRKNQVVTSQLNNRGNLKAVSKMIIVNGVAFFLCLTLWYIIKLLITVEVIFRGYVITGKIIQLYLYSFVLVLINSMINPFIYGTFNSRYRAALKRACSCKTGE